MPAREVADPVPSYEARMGTTSHTFTQHESEIGLAITFFSEAASPKSVPTFYDEGTISGIVQVSFRKKRKMESLSVKLHGYQKIDMLQWLDKEEKDHDRLFLEFDAHLWPPEDTAGGSMEPGVYNFPFSFTLPKETINLGRSGTTYPLPPSFTTEYFPDHLVYELVACARRGGFFREDEFLITPIRYVPRRVAAALSPLRALSYEHGHALSGPENDPEGWNVQELALKGRLFGRDVEVKCEIAVATPFDYPRGYPIPFLLTVRSSDAQALSAFSAPGGVIVSLTRLVVRFKRARGNDSVKSKVVSRGVCWGNEVFGPDGVRMQGEIQVPLSIGASFRYKTLSLLYHISLAPGVTGFDTKDESPKLVIPVDIAYFPTHAKPRSYAPPAPYTSQTPAGPPLERPANLVTVA